MGRELHKGVREEGLGQFILFPKHTTNELEVADRMRRAGQQGAGGLPPRDVADDSIRLPRTAVLETIPLRYK